MIFAPPAPKILSTIKAVMNIQETERHIEIALRADNMTDNELLQAIYNDTQELKHDVQELKQDTQELK